MNYLKQYEKLVQKAKTKSYEDIYTEVHHIIPKSIGGKDDDSNLVRLSAREHYIAHILLVKIYPENKNLIRAVNMMCNVSNRTVKVRNNRMYKWLRERFIANLSETQKGKNNTQYGTIWITDGVQNKKIKKEDIIPAGWKRGFLQPSKGKHRREINPEEYRMIVLKDLGIDDAGKRRVLLKCPYCGNTTELRAFSSDTKNKECCNVCAKLRR